MLCVQIIPFKKSYILAFIVLRYPTVVWVSCLPFTFIYRHIVYYIELVRVFVSALAELGGGSIIEM